MSLNAFLAIDKPAGISSFAVIRALRKLSGIRKIGHTGTLDPFATGLLVCCFGSYTRLASFVEVEAKTYLATIKLGEKTNTGDTEGEVIETAAVPEVLPDPAELATRALSLCELPVPAYSAIKVNGERAYKLARQGVEVQIPSRAVKVYDFKLFTTSDNSLIDSPSQISYRCTVSKGTYIRSLSQWLAEQLGTVAHTTALRREKIGNIDISEAFKLEDLSPENLSVGCLDTRKVLSSFPFAQLTSEQYQKAINGNDINNLNYPEGTKVALQYADQLIAIGESSDGCIHPRIVLK